MFSVFIVVVGVLVYTWVVYPVVVLWVGRRAVGSLLRPVRRDYGGHGGQGAVSSEQKTEGGECRSDELPYVAILFSAHNEESVILQRLENLAALDYPADKLHVFVGVDGGTDRTAEIALEWARPQARVHVIVSPKNHGKTAMLKRLVGDVNRETIDHREDGIQKIMPCICSSPSPLRGEGERGEDNILLVFTDANTMFAPDALRHLVAPFASPDVGGVCGRLVFLPPEGAAVISYGLSVVGQKTNNQQPITNNSAAGGSTDESIYWNLETRLKAAESALDSCLGANGAIYAIRASLFPAYFPDNTIIDDFVIGMKVRERGGRLVYEPAAVATEELPATVSDEWRRRVRIGAGAYQALVLCWRCLLPRYGVFAWMFWSHKVLRWLTPHLLVAGLFVICDLLWVSTWGVVMGYGLLGVAGVVLAGLMTVQGRKALKLIVYFITMQAALFVGFLRFCKGNLSGAWERTERRV